MKDVHAMAPSNGPLDLHHVGVSGVRKPIQVQRPGRVVTLAAEFRVTVDLPADRKGSDLSRNAEVLAELVDRTATRPVASLEAACLTVARELLVRHPYARESRVEASAEYFSARGLRPERESLEAFTLLAEATASRHPDGQVSVRRSIGAEAVGMTACPCAMATCREALEREFPALREPEWAGFPIISHNQRNRTRLILDLTEDAEIEAEAIIEAIEAAQSSPTFDILKRGDEATVVLNAHRRPKFVEDVLRDLLADVPVRFPGLGDATVVRAQTVSEESIHKYDVVAAHRATVGEIRSAPSA
ncbi:MAG: GTP cyclohydrolase MptA [Thermoplasmata archaeon]